jgi:ankyrin repeat protein
MVNDIFQIVRLNEEAEFDRILPQMDINLRNEYGQNLLHEAIAYGATGLARKLIDNGVDINEADNKGLIPLHYTGLYKDAAIASMIINAGGNLNVRDEHYNTPFWTAVFNAKGNYDVVKVMAANGADALNPNKHGRSPLDFAN